MEEESHSGPEGLTVALESEALSPPQWSGQTDVVLSEYSDQIFGKLYIYSYVYVWKIWPFLFQKEYWVFLLNIW